jgi:hypothetical protein
MGCVPDKRRGKSKKGIDAEDPETQRAQRRTGMERALEKNRRAPRTPPCPTNYCRRADLFGAVACLWGVFYTHSFVVWSGRLLASLASRVFLDFYDRGGRYCGCGLVVCVSALASAGRGGESPGVAERCDRGARSLGRTAYSREFRGRYGRGPRLCNGAGPAMANGSATACCPRPTLGDPGTGHLECGQTISNA